MRKIFALALVLCFVLMCLTSCINGVLLGKTTETTETTEPNLSSTTTTTTNNQNPPAPPAPTVTLTVNYYVGGEKQEAAPEKGDYVVYAQSSDGDEAVKWDYESWGIKDLEEAPKTSKTYDIYFFEAEAVYSSYNELKSKLSVHKSGDIVGISSYYEGEERGASLYKASGSSAILVPFSVGDEKIISVDMFGAYANGKSDDVDAIHKAFDFSDCTVIEFEGENYLQKSKIILNKSNVTVDGNGARISNRYKEGNVVWQDFLIEKASNVTLKNIELYCAETNGKGTLFRNNDHVQLFVGNAKGIVLKEVSVSCPNNTENDRHITSIWLNGGINDITVDGCVIQNYSKSSVGGGIWVSAGEGQTSNNITIINSFIEKSSHDEALAFFIGNFNNILVENNYIYTHDEPIKDASAHAIGFGVNAISSVVSNAVCRNNIIEVVAVKDAITFASVDGLDIYDNQIIFSNNSAYDPLEYAVFRVSEPDKTTQKNLNIYNNNIVVFNTTESTLKSLVYNLGAGCSVYGNTFEMNTPVGRVVDGTVKDVSFYDNTIIFNKGIKTSYEKYAENNEITVK